MASGLNGQRFTFLGYLPSEKARRVQKFKEIEQVSRKHHETQIFIETPYRNQHLLEDMVATCQPATRLCVACDLTLDSETIISQPVKQWKAGALPDLDKRPTVFLLLA